MGHRRRHRRECIDGLGDSSRRQGPEDAAGVTSEDIDAMIAYGDLGRAERVLEAKLRGSPDDEALKAKLAEVRARS